MLSSKNNENYFSTFQLHKVTNKQDDSFIGIKIKNGSIDFYYPETYDLNFSNQTELRNEILSILNTISLAKSKSNSKVKVESSFSNNSSLPLISYVWMIYDFIKNGFYINRERIYKNNQNGKVNWKKTINTQPIISNGNVIYNNIVVEVNNKLDNIIVDINKYCVKKSIDLLGWLFGLRSSSFIQVPQYRNSMKQLYISSLLKELNNTYDDIKKLRLKHMLNIIEGINNDSYQDEIIYGVDSYAYIFERMIDHVFGNQDASKFNPGAKWFIKNIDKPFESSKLRPDTILLYNKIAYILDSKYYRYGYTFNNQDLPETTSIQKQITYGDFIKQNKLDGSIRNTRNAFILPFNKNDYMQQPSNILEYIGYSNTDYRDGEDEHDIVHAFLIDLKYVISTWNQNNHIEEIKKLVNDIENEQKEYNLQNRSFTFSGDNFVIDSDQTYSLGIKDSIYVSYLNTELKRALKNNEITFVDGLFVINNKKYVQLENNKKKLTNYAARHMSECCLVFDNNQKITKEDFKFSFCKNCVNRQNSSENWLNEKIPHNKEIFKNAKYTDIDRVLEDNTDAIDLIKKLSGAFSSNLNILMEENGFSNNQLAKESGINNHKIADYLKGKYKPSLSECVALCATFNLHPLVSNHFLASAGYDIHTPKEEKEAFYNFLINQCSGEQLNEWNIKINKANKMEWLLP